MNCYGGDVFQGFPICNKIKGSVKRITGRAEGIVASMATVIFTACHTREIATGSRLVIHKPSVSLYAQSQKLRSTADDLDTIEQDLVKCYSEDTGMSTEDLTKRFLKPDNDYYMNEDEAIKYGFASAKYDSGYIKQSVPEDVLNKSDLKAVAGFYQQQFTNSLNLNMDMKNLAAFVALLSLSADASEEAILAKVTAMKNELETAKARVNILEQLQKETHGKSVKALIDAAISDGKITPAQRETFTGLAEKDLDGVTKVLSDMKPHVSIASQMPGPNAAGAVDPTAGKTYNQVWNMDKSGKMLAELQKSNPDKFNKMKAEPNKVFA
jgi:hypothetical protein